MYLILHPSRQQYKCTSRQSYCIAGVHLNDGFHVVKNLIMSFYKAWYFWYGRDKDVIPPVNSGGKCVWKWITQKIMITFDGWEWLQNADVTYKGNMVVVMCTLCVHLLVLVREEIPFCCLNCSIHLQLYDWIMIVGGSASGLRGVSIASIHFHGESALGKVPLVSIFGIEPLAEGMLVRYRRNYITTCSREGYMFLSLKWFVESLLVWRK